MKMLIDIRIDGPEKRIGYRDKIMLMGSCFTEHIGDALLNLKFDVSQNPHGILFDPLAVTSAITSYIDHQKYASDDLVHFNELWRSWQHHSVYSGMEKQEVLDAINASQDAAHRFLKDARWLVLTLGTSFSYRLVENGKPVANCHRAPHSWFNKHMMTIDETVSAMDNCLHRLLRFNPDLNIILTVSPVRHIRDGIVDNNRSKARLIESVHHLAGKFERIYYFPSYELVIDVLRDYRFYDIDLVHPNYQATAYVIETFMKNYLSEDAAALARELEQILLAKKHKAFQPLTEAHRNFLRTHADKTRELMKAYPFLSLQDELAYFEQQPAAR